MPPAVLTSQAPVASTLAELLAGPRRVRVLYQPIVDLERGAVRGHEAVARFPFPADWFGAAAALGRPGVLEAQVLEAALVSRPLLRRRRFVLVRLSPAALLAPAVARLLAGEALTGIVVALTGPADPAALDDLRRRGAVIAGVEESGGDAAMVLLDAAHDDLLERHAGAEARPVVTGIDTGAQLDALRRAGVRLGQGLALGGPVAAMAELPRAVADRLGR